MARNSITVGSESRWSSRWPRKKRDLFIEHAKEYIELFHEGVLETGPAVNRVRDIGKQLTAAAGLPKGDIDFFVTKALSCNALAKYPVVVMDYGMYLFCRTDNELAAILAHEIGHCLYWLEQPSGSDKSDGIQDNSAPRIGRVKNHLRLIHCASDSNERFDEVQTLRESREREFYADRRAVGLLNHAGYDPNAGVMCLWRGLVEQFKTGDVNLSSDEQSTHPSYLKRIAAANCAIRELERVPKTYVGVWIRKNSTWCN